MIQQILLAITFVYGPLYLLTRTTFFKSHLDRFIETIHPAEKYPAILKWLDLLFFYFSLIYQAWFWLFKTI